MTAFVSFRAPVGAPHLAADADHRRHRGIDDHVVRRMQVGDALGRVDHRQLRPMLMAGVQVADDLFALGFRQRRDLVVEIHHAVVDVDAELVEELAVLLERLLVEDAHRVAEDDRVRHLHHRRLDVQREHHAGLVRIFHLALVEVEQRLLAHEHAVDDLAGEQRHFRLQHQRVAALGQQFHPHVACLVERHRLFAVVEIAGLHRRHVGARRLAPHAHRMRVLACEALHGQRRAPVRVALAQHRVHRAAQALRIAGADRLLLVRLRALGEVRQLVALRLQFLDRADQLVLGCTDVGQLDDVGVGLERQLAERGQVVGALLFVGQVVGKLAQDPRRNRDVALRHLDAGRGR